MKKEVILQLLSIGIKKKQTQLCKDLIIFASLLI